MKKKDYLKLFVDYCRKNELWFSIYGDCSIDEVTDCEICKSFNPHYFYKLGTKAAYDWLIKAHKKVKNVNN